MKKPYVEIIFKDWTTRKCLWSRFQEIVGRMNWHWMVKIGEDAYNIDTIKSVHKRYEEEKVIEKWKKEIIEEHNK